MSEILWTLVAFLLTLMVFSYLFGDNILFRIASYLLVGVTAGYAVVVIIDTVLVPQVIQPLLSGSLWTLIPLVMGIFIVMRLSPRLAGPGKVSMAFLAGVGAALAISGAVLGTVLPQIRGTIVLFTPENNIASWVQGLFVLLGIVAVLAYFQFGALRRTGEQPQRPTYLRWLAKAGEWFMMVTLGAIFAGVLLAALSALVERVDFIHLVIRGWF
jgi:hypothetical protein